MRRERPLLFSTQSYGYLRKRIASSGAFEQGQVETRVFPDGERYLRLLTDVESRDVVLVGGTTSDPDTLELYDLASGIAGYGAESLTLVIPYFGYSTMDRVVKYGEVVTAKTRAYLISAISELQKGCRIILLDPHSEGLTYYFEGALTPVQLSARQVIGQIAREIGDGNFVLACTDAGRAKWVQSLAYDLDVPVSFVFKRRVSGKEVETTAVSAQVKGKNVIIYDDMVRTGGSLINAAKAYKKAGASSIAAIATHGVLPGAALSRLRDSGLLTVLVCTDSHPRVEELKGDFLRVESVAPLLAAAVEQRYYIAPGYED